jgi:predicted ribosomally synthesized peptide with nif11-like leader
MSVESLQQFQQLVLETPELRQQLLEIGEPEAFLSAVVKIASERGYGFTPEEANAAMLAGRISWLQRWAWW